MIFLVTKKKRERLLRDSLENMVEWCNERLNAGDLDLDDTIRPSRDAATTLLDIWFEEDS